MLTPRGRKQEGIQVGHYVFYYWSRGKKIYKCGCYRIEGIKAMEKGCGDARDRESNARYTSGVSLYPSPLSDTAAIVGYSAHLENPVNSALPVMLLLSLAKPREHWEHPAPSFSTPGPRCVQHWYSVRHNKWVWWRGCPELSRSHQSFQLGMRA